MRCVIAPESGGPEALRMVDRDVPEPAEGEVLVRVVAAGVNRADLAQREGNYPPPAGAPDVLGMEVAGLVEEVGVGVEGWAVGDPVCALLAGGGYAEFAAVPAGQLLPAPAGLPLPHGAGLPEAACTVWSNLVDTAGLRSGEWLLVHGGASGIGTMAIQVGVALGARVAVTAGSAAKLERCRAFGAELAVDYHDDFVGAVRDGTGGHGADVVLDIVGAAYLARNVDVLAPDGRLVVIGLQKGRRAELDLGTMLVRRLSVAATSLRSRPLAQKSAIVERVRAGVWPMVESGAVRPVIEATFDLADVVEAHRSLEAGAHVGKILLSVSEVG